MNDLMLCYVMSYHVVSYHIITYYYYYLLPTKNEKLEHDIQFKNKITEYDGMAKAYIKQINDKHSELFLKYKIELREQAMLKSPKWSRDLLDLRRRQVSCGKGKSYLEAEKLKKTCDKIEEAERKVLDAEQAIEFGRKEGKYRLQQHAEVHALQKRIEGRRKEHLKQRGLGE